MGLNFSSCVDLVYADKNNVKNIYGGQEADNTRFVRSVPDNRTSLHSLSATNHIT